MKKIIKSLLVLIVVLSLFGCKQKPDITGEYTLVKIDAGETSATEEDIAKLKDMGMEIALSVTKDGKAVLDVFGEASNFTYDLEAKTFTSESGSVMNFSYENKQLTLTDSSGSLIFVPKE